MLRPDMHDAPAAMRARPIDHRGFYVPWFVTDRTPDGLWDFRHVRPERKNQALRERLDWVTGEPLGRHMAFVIGPMCTVNRIAADPPVKLTTARWSARVCPFLSRPLAKRPDGKAIGNGPGIPVSANPGICAIWVTDKIEVSRYGLINLGDPSRVEWWAKGREATAEEIQHGFASGVTRLEKMAMEESEDAMRLLGRMVQRACDTVGLSTPDTGEGS